MRAHLEFFGEFWNSLLPDGDHEHEVGEDRTGCANCQLEERWQQMSNFERACWNWYQDFANPLTITSGLLSGLVSDEGLSGLAKRLFVRALGMIHGTVERVAHERARMAAKAQES